MFFSNQNNFEVSNKNPDSRLIGCDGSTSVHSILLIVNSSLLQSIFDSLDDPTEVVVIVPDYKTFELETVVSVIYGEQEYGFVSGQILDDLGMNQYKMWAYFESLISEDDTNVDNNLTTEDFRTNVEYENHIDDIINNEAVFVEVPVNQVSVAPTVGS